ncbi:MAG: glycerophosphodiester phosphodiesterase family protein [Blastococcus sp.]
MPAVRYAFLDGPTPLAMAHRGGAIEHLENTLPAFEACVDQGYQYLETDVRVTADGVLVVFHDATLERVTDRTGRIESLPWSEVAAARIGGREPILRLEDLLGAWPDVRFNIDLKDEAGIPLLPGVLRRTSAWDRVCLTSFSGARLRAARKLLDHPVCMTPSPSAIAAVRYSIGVGSPGYAGYAGSAGPAGPGRSQEPPTRRLARRLAQAGVCCAQIPGWLATRSFVRRAHAFGLDVHVWTINDRARMIRFLDLGADGIMTDDIETLREVLIERGQWYPRMGA